MTLSRKDGSRNRVESEIAEQNRTEGDGGYTFNAFPPEDYEGMVLVVACVRLGDHAHLDISSGRQIASPEFPPVWGSTRSPTLRFGGAGKVILRWPEWLELRELLDSAPWVRIAEVERPTLGQLERHAA